MKTMYSYISAQSLEMATNHWMKAIPSSSVSLMSAHILRKFIDLSAFNVFFLDVGISNFLLRVAF